MKQTALIFPYTDVSPSLVERLAPFLETIYLYRPIGLAAPDGLADSIESGKMVVRTPGDLDPKTVKAAMAEFNSWVEGAKDVKELAHLRGLALGRDEPEDPSPSALMSAIRSYGRADEEASLHDHVFFLIAQEYDRRRREVDRLIDDIRSYEAGLGAAVGLKAEDEEDRDEAVVQALDPLEIPELPDDPLLNLRLKAWAGLYRTEPVQAEVWLTGPVVIGHLASILTELGPAEPRPEVGLNLATASAEDLAAGLHAARMAALDLEKPEPELVDAGADLKLWAFPGPMMENLLGLAPGAWGGSVVCEVSGWRNG